MITSTARLAIIATRDQNYPGVQLDFETDSASPDFSRILRAAELAERGTRFR